MRRIFGIDTHFDGGSARRRRGGFPWLAGRQPDHPFDQIDAGHFLGDAVFDLQACVDLEKIELLSPHIENEFDGTGGAVAHRAGPAARRRRGVPGARHPKVPVRESPR